MKRYILVLVLSLLALSPILSGCKKLWQSPLDQTDLPNNPVVLPVISELFPAAITNNSAVIVWKTPKPADSTVVYGTSASAMNTTVTDQAQVIDHAITLSSLTPGTTYFFLVSNKDSMGNMNLSTPMNFTTELLASVPAGTSDTIGPSISALAISPTPTAGATLLSVSATISDATTGGSNVSAAEVFIDTPGTSGAGAALTAQDGSFNSAAENINGTINIAALSVGTHKIYVHGKDSAGIWGELVSADLSVTAGTGSDTTGPLASNFSISPNPTAGAASAAITATISDTGTGGSNIAAAEYFVNTQGTNGSGTALSGTFTSATVIVTGSITTSGLSTGTHRVYMHGRDANNNWGGAQFVDLVISSAAATKPDITSTTTVSYSLTSPLDHSTEAVWIEDNAGNFVRTLFIGSYVNEQPAYLPTWSTVSGGKTDGTTGASKAAGSFSVNWKPMVSTGTTTLVNPGTYRYRIEYRQEGSASTVCTGAITIGTTASSSTGTNSGKISALSGTYTP